MTTSRNYRIEKTQNGNAVDFYATHEFFATLADAQAELLAIYNNYCSDDMSAEDWAEAESKERETGAWLDKANGEVMGFEYDNSRVTYAIVEYHTYDVYYCDDANEPANLKTFLSQEAAEEYIWEEMRDVARVDAEHPCTDDVFASSAVACYRVYRDMNDEPEMAYESDYFYTGDDTHKEDTIMRTMTEEQAKEICKEAANRVDMEFSGANIDYEILSAAPIEGEDAYLVTFKGGCSSSSAVIYGDGTAFFIDDWQGSYPTDKTQLANYNWVDEHFCPVPIFDGMPRRLFF